MFKPVQVQQCLQSGEQACEWAIKDKKLFLLSLAPHFPPTPYVIYVLPHMHLGVVCLYAGRCTLTEQLWV